MSAKEHHSSFEILWAKKARDNSLKWLPLSVHLSDTAETAKILWDNWIPGGVKETLADNSSNGDLKSVRQLFIFLGAVHDLGKATVAFQQKQSGNNDLDERIKEKLAYCGYEAFSRSPAKTPHALASQILLERAGCCESIAVIAGAHHGKPSDRGYDENDKNYPGNYGKGIWQNTQAELIERALSCAGFHEFSELPEPNMAAQALLSGILIVADWIASNEIFFPLIHIDEDEARDSAERAQEAFCNLHLTPLWQPASPFSHSNIYAKRFNFDVPNRMQESVFESAVMCQNPGIMIIEAPMGSGKTEAALAAAEVLAHKTGRSGVYFTLPTQATSDGVFPRMREWINSLDGDPHSIKLVHGKAQFNQDWMELPRFGVNSDVDEATSGSVVHEWFSGRKLALLADFAVGTIDQLLLAALKAKHVMLRHAGLANKVVIIDECHAYDAYMSSYLMMALQWLGAYGVPVIILSATLPVQKRVEVLNAYLGKTGTNSHELPVTNHNYALITLSDGDQVIQQEVPGTDNRCISVRLKQIEFGQIPEVLAEVIAGGGCAGIVVNTVRRAQELAKMLRSKFGDENIRLLHSRFIAPERIAKEKQLLQELGKPADNPNRPELCIVIGTQVIEQSLDIDFDILISEICPIDLLLQRIGRLHRHEGRIRPPLLSSPVCFITGIENGEFDSGTSAVYGEYLLQRTLSIIPDTIMLPDDISPMIESVYRDDGAESDEKKAWELKVEKSKKSAENFRISRPSKRQDRTLVNWLYTSVADDADGKIGERAVRESDPSIEVLAVFERDGIYTVNEKKLTDVLDDAAALEVARQCIRLPAVLSANDCIEELEKVCIERVPGWQESLWLKGELFLIFDEDNSASLRGYRITYSAEEGLSYEKEE